MSRLLEWGFIVVGDDPNGSVIYVTTELGKRYLEFLRERPGFNPKG